MNSKEISSILHKRFVTQLYQLSNSFVYGWESDFFSMTKSGYAQEVEIKISRGDFFADFKKTKHQLFDAIINKKQLIVENIGLWDGEYMGTYSTYRYFHKWQRYNPVSFKSEYDHEGYNNHYKDYILYEERHNFYAPCSRIRIRDLSKENFPNKFYYCVPDGLVKKEEIPAYAGLIYIKDKEASIIKEAPFLHKNKLDLRNILLNKFYYETLELRRKMIYYGKEPM